MPRDWQVQETIGRFVSIMVAYHNGERTSDSKDRMVAQTRNEARIVAPWGLSFQEHDEILGQVRVELLLRYGYEAGERINAEFVHAFDKSIEECARRSGMARGASQAIGRELASFEPIHPDWAWNDHHSPLLARGQEQRSR